MPALPSRQAPPLVLQIDRRTAAVRAAMASLRSLLDRQEIERLDRLRRSDDQERFLLGRGVLRLTLGRWLEQDPASLAFQAGPHGKPALEGGPPFNLSHSGDLVLLAFHPVRAVGVDVEQPRPGVEWHPIARRMFAPELVATLDSLPPAEQERAFLEAWCRLEAQLKARGTGLAGPDDGATGRSGMDLWDLLLPGGHLGAVALAGTLTDHPAAGAAPRP
ncbi:4'-phosphopantetheinyl transferase superfamily protein [Cyanobium sp. FGCU-6]|nr:4'-phosphopantetheinyl transferase superfamily protein [Cyanobium sp. FGCU6]